MEFTLINNKLFISFFIKYVLYIMKNCCISNNNDNKCFRKSDKKIYLANHDHCGPCGQIQDFKIKK